MFVDIQDETPSNKAAKELKLEGLLGQLIQSGSIGEDLLPVLMTYYSFEPDLIAAITRSLNEQQQKKQQAEQQKQQQVQQMQQQASQSQMQQQAVQGKVKLEENQMNNMTKLAVEKLKGANKPTPK